MDQRRLKADPEQKPVVFRPEIRKWFDDILAAYMSNFVVEVDSQYPYVFPRGLAFVILAVDSMYKATRDVRYLDQVQTLTDVLLRFQTKRDFSHGGFSCLGDSIMFDCHAAGIVAVARAAVTREDTSYAEAARRGLGAYAIDPNGKLGHDVYVISNDKLEKDSYFWTFKAGLLLRSLDALDVLEERRLIKLTESEKHKIEHLRKLGLQYISRTNHPRGTLNEFYTSCDAQETNSETQSWVALGLFRTERVSSEFLE
jgi:hypothetical protein